MCLMSSYCLHFTSRSPACLHACIATIFCPSFTLPSRLPSIPFVSLELRFELFSPSALNDAFKPTQTDRTALLTENRRGKYKKKTTKKFLKINKKERNEQKILSDVKQNELIVLMVSSPLAERPTFNRAMYTQPPNPLVAEGRCTQLISHASYMLKFRCAPIVSYTIHLPWRMR